MCSWNVNRGPWNEIMGPCNVNRGTWNAMLVPRNVNRGRECVYGIVECE